MWLVPGRTPPAPPAVEPHGPDRAPTPAARAAPRSRRAIEEDLRRLCDLQTEMRSGHIPVEGTFAAIIARRADRLLDELGRDHRVVAADTRGRADASGN